MSVVQTIQWNAFWDGPDSATSSSTSPTPPPESSAPSRPPLQADAASEGKKPRRPTPHFSRVCFGDYGENTPFSRGCPVHRRKRHIPALGELDGRGIPWESRQPGPPVLPSSSRGGGVGTGLRQRPFPPLRTSPPPRRQPEAGVFLLCHPLKAQFPETRRQPSIRSNQGRLRGRGPRPPAHPRACLQWLCAALALGCI